MALRFRGLHPTFVAEVSAIDLRQVHDAETLAEIRAGMDEYAVLVFRDQPFTDDEQLAFAQRLDGQLHTKTGRRRPEEPPRQRGARPTSRTSTSRGHPQVRRPAPGVRARQPPVAHRRVVPGSPGPLLDAVGEGRPAVGADTEFADMRAAYDALPAEIKSRLEGLRVHHSIAHSRQTLGFEFSRRRQEKLKGAVHPLVRTLPRSGRRSLYLASHASRIVDWPLPEGRLLLRDLIEHATQREFVYRHAWRVGDLVIWDNRATMHRARPFDDPSYRRELRRVTTLDVEPAARLTPVPDPRRRGRPRRRRGAATGAGRAPLLGA